MKVSIAGGKNGRCGKNTLLEPSGRNINLGGKTAVDVKAGVSKETSRGNFTILGLRNKHKVLRLYFFVAAQITQAARSIWITLARQL